MTGFVCSYTKRIKVVLTFKDISWEMLNLTYMSHAHSAVLDAIAASAGVPRQNVHITGIFTGKRRLLAYESDENLNHRMFITVSGAESLDVETLHSLLGDAKAHIALEHKHTLRVVDSRSSVSKWR
jgi:hypothetical protein